MRTVQVILQFEMPQQRWSVYSLIFVLCHIESYYPSMWISTPPLLIQDTSLTVYFCSSSYFFYYAYWYGTTGNLTVAIRKASISSTWSYTDHLLSCFSQECLELYQQNISNYLVTYHKFSSLQPNTLYSLALLGCYEDYGSCTVGGSYFSYRVNITTRPEGE